ncbi:MAG: recJ [Candidatus Adlerbacteria bacterium]|nr:recJ [Candidatus Adlerbacteria bacterium]
MKEYLVRDRLHDSLLEHLMLARGIEESGFADFLEPDYVAHSHDPFLLPGMGVAVERIISAIKNAEPICVWSDYDADGVPGGVMLAHFFRDIGLQVRHYIPHRHKEGYGLNKEGLKALAEQGIKLVITCDLGTTEVEHIAFANSLGIDVIVTDHHLEPPVLPDALAIINPKLSSSKYPFDGLCGAGVAWKLVQGVLLKYRPESFPEGKEKWYLDLVGIGTLSDMVPLVGENRMLAQFGLKVMRRGRRPGLAALLKLLRIQPRTLTEDDIGFMVSPRINAASRMDSPEAAARLLATENVEEAGELARELNKINDERKTLVASTVKEVNKRLLLGGLEGPVIVMGNPSWRPGILGLVANSLVEAHQKPAFLWGREGGELLRGSCRSDGIVNIVELMRAAGPVFEHFGGHAASGGFALHEEHAHELPAKLSAAYDSLKSVGAGVKKVTVDREMDLSELPHALKSLDRLAPFGIANEKPLFIFPNATIGAMRMFGKQQNHLDIVFQDDFNKVGGIAFFSTPDSFQKRPQEGERADVVGNIERDWKNQPRIRVVDIL